MRSQALPVLLLHQVLALAWHPTDNQAVLSGLDEDLDFKDSHYYYGISTFANVPYVNCFIGEEAKRKRYDIAILGAPHDTVSVMCRRVTMS